MSGPQTLEGKLSPIWEKPDCDFELEPAENPLQTRQEGTRDQLAAVTARFRVPDHPGPNGKRRKNYFYPLGYGEHPESRN